MIFNNADIGAYFDYAVLSLAKSLKIPCVLCTTILRLPACLPPCLPVLSEVLLRLHCVDFDAGVSPSDDFRYAAGSSYATTYIVEYYEGLRVSTLS